MLSLVCTRVRVLCKLRPQLRSISQYTVKRKGGIVYADIYTKDDVMDNFARLQSKYGTERPAVEHDPILMDLLQSCGPDLIYHTQKERHQLLDTVWKKLHTAKLVQHSVYYNRLLQLFIADDYNMSPTNFLDSMEANNVAPNTTTLAIVLEAYCKAGQMEQARAVLDHIKSLNVVMDKETSISAYRSLSVGMALKNDWDGVDSALNSLKSSGLVPNHKYYNAVLAAFAQAGNQDAIQQLLAKMVAEGIHPVDSTFEAILDGLARGNHVDGIPTIFCYLKSAYWAAEDLRKMAVLFASRGQFDASVKLIECLIDNGDLQYGTITTTIELVLNHIVRHCEGDTAKLGSEIGKVIDLGIPPRDAFECLLFKYELCDYHMDLVRVMWERGEPVRHTYLYHAMANFVKNGQSPKFHNLMVLLRDTQLEADEVTIRYLEKFVGSQTKKARDIDTIVTVLKNYNLLENPDTVKALYGLVTEVWKIPHMLYSHYNAIPKASRQPEYLAMLLARMVVYAPKVVHSLPNFFGRLVADINDMDYFCAQIETFLKGVLMNCSFSVAVTTIQQLIKKEMTECIPQSVFSKIAFQIRHHGVDKSDDLKELLCWMISTGRWESQQSSTIMSALHKGDAEKAIKLFDKVKKDGMADKFAYSYYLMALITKYKDNRKEVDQALQECYQNGIQILPVAIENLLYVTSLYFRGAHVADMMLSNAAKYFNYKPGPFIISVLARGYSKQSNLEGVMKYNGVLKKMNCEHLLPLHDKLSDVYLQLGKPGDIMTMIDDLESCGKPVTTKIVSALIKAHCNIGDIAGALKAYYDTCHFAAPRKAVLGLVLEKCIITDDKINIGPVVNMLLHSGAKPSYINQIMILSHIRFGDLDKARWIARTERLKCLDTETCVNTAKSWYRQDLIDGLVGLLILCHEQNWSMEHDIKQLIVHYILRSDDTTKSKALNAYNRLTEAGVPLQPELHRYIESKLTDQAVQR
ncbi:uncharacterized protein [Dysidea avara]|uniref:uncharacterized protein n=1 Tax=Dysidea avara TaxID=196820 RepID=UPI00331EE336